MRFSTKSSLSMMSPRWRKVLRDLGSNRTRTVLVVLSIAVGVFAVGMIASTQMLLSTDLDAAYSATRPASAILFAGDFDDELVRTIRRVEGVQDAEGRRRTTVRIQVAPGQWRNLQLEAIGHYDDMRLHILQWVQGAWPPGERELLLERHSLDLANAQVGSTILVETPDGRQKELRVSGLVHDLHRPPAAFVGTPFGYITLDTLEWLGFGRSYGELHILVTGDTKDQKHSEEVADRVKKAVEKSGRSVYWTNIPRPGEHPATETVNIFLMVLGVLGGLSLFLSAFLVVNTIIALLTQQVPQIGVMKAIGARTGQIVRMYLGAVLIYGLLSLLVAVPLGAISAYAFTLYLADLINFDLAGFRIPLQALALEIMIALVAPLLAALWPILSGAGITVHEAISANGLGRDHFGASFIDRLVERVRGLPRPLLLSLRNTFRRKARLALTLFTLTLGGAIFIAVLSVHASVGATLDDFLAYWQYDIDVNFEGSYRVDQIRNEALRIPGVTVAESWNGNTARRTRPDGRDGPDFNIIAIPAETRLIQPVLLSGRWLLPGDENGIVLNTEVLKEEPDIQVGDEITLKIMDKEYSWRVVGFVRAVLTGSIGYVNYPYFSRLTHSVDRSAGVQVQTAQHDAVYQMHTANDLKAHYDSIGMKVRALNTTSSTRQNIESQFNILVIFMTVMAVLLAVVGGLGLTGTMSMNVLERSREIGVMRAIGAGDRAVLQIFLVEGLLIGILSWVLGGLASFPISRVLSDNIGIAFTRAPLTYRFSISGAIGWLAVVLLLAALASFWPAWRATHLRVREVLAYE